MKWEFVMGTEQIKGIPILKFDNKSISKITDFVGSGIDKLKGLYNDIFKQTPVDSKLAHTSQYWDEYSCGSDVGIFIGDRWVDDVITIQYTLTNNKSPVYGYMSENMDAVAKGTRIVQGQFAIAFREMGYLVNILNEYTKKMNPNRQLPYLSEKTNLTLNRYEEDAMLALYTPADKFGYVNSEYGDYIDIEGFDIFVAFGDTSETVRGGTVEIINNCHITSISKVCEPSGEPIAEIYTFFARGINEYEPLYRYNVGEHDMSPTILRVDDEASMKRDFQKILDNYEVSPSKLDLKWQASSVTVPPVGLEETKTEVEMQSINNKLDELGFV
jgi:hypothetical protein